MLKTRKQVIDPVIKSFGGIHLSVFLNHQSDSLDVSHQIKLRLHEAYEWLHEVLPHDEKNEFLRPVELFASQINQLNFSSGSTAIFRNKNHFYLFHLPNHTESACHVANSFHTKPLFKWLQSDPEYLILRMEQDLVELYWKTTNDSKLLVEVTSNQTRLDQLINELHSTSLPMLIFNKSAKDKISPFHFHRNFELGLWRYFPDHTPDFQSAVTFAENSMKEQAENSISQSLQEFEQASALNLAKKNIFQIAKAAIDGKVKKIIVAEDICIFGKIDLQTGGIALHPIDLDDEDDDITDDLAQIVAVRGGEVVVVDKSKMPDERPVVAILHQKEKRADKSRFLILDQFESGNT